MESLNPSDENIKMLRNKLKIFIGTTILFAVLTIVFIITMDSLQRLNNGIQFLQNQLYLSLLILLLKEKLLMIQQLIIIEVLMLPSQDITLL